MRSPWWSRGMPCTLQDSTRIGSAGAGGNRPATTSTAGDVHLRYWATPSASAAATRTATIAIQRDIELLWRVVNLALTERTN